MSASLQHYRPWNSPGKNTGVACRALLLAYNKALLHIQKEEIKVNNKGKTTTKSEKEDRSQLKDDPKSGKGKMNKNTYDYYFRETKKNEQKEGRFISPENWHLCKLVTYIF